MFNEIREWGVSRGLTGPSGKATVFGQIDKLMEEQQELIDSLNVGHSARNLTEAADAIGDMTVVLVLLAELLGLRFEDCVQGALDVISKRTGTMVNGVFVKDEFKVE